MIREVAFLAKTLVAGRRSSAALREFRASDRMSADELDELSLKRALAHARFAMENTTFYRDRYRRAGVEAGDLTSREAFESLPVVHKSDVREHFEAIKTEQATPKTSSVSRTGGSTGFPLHVLRDLRFPARALEWRLFDWWRVSPWDDRGIVTRHMLEGRARLRHDLAWLPSRRVQLDAYHIDDESTAVFVRAWNRLDRPFLIGYGGGVLELVRRAQRQGLSIQPPTAVALTAAPLTEGVRHEIESGLGAPCFDHYRSAEVPWIAGECGERDGMHVFADVRRVEILDSSARPLAADGEGTVVVTDMTNHVFPLVRYNLGDVSRLRPGTCACGRHLPRLGSISGRSSDALVLPDGSIIAGAMGHIFDDAPLSVRQFEIVQAEDYSITLRCIPGSTPSAHAGIQAASNKLRAAVAGSVPVTVELVDSIPQVGGKMRFIRSQVVQDLQAPS